jgi:serine phosphatase RsbU (regulator of sigma subunit)
MQWAGANNPLYLIRNNELVEIKADRQGIGYASKLIPFINHTFQLEGRNLVYIFSDGFADQFGGPARKKFMSFRLREKLVEISSLPMYEQKEKLNKVFETWKGELQQIDDVCIVGIRI